MAGETVTESPAAFGRAACVKTPHEWDAELSGPPHLCSARSGWDGALIRRWRDTAAIMEQPPLDHHYVAIHLGGPKFVKRRHDGPSVSVNVEVGSITVVPAGTAFSWKTDGPIDFAHLYLAPEMIDRLVREEFDREPRAVELIDCVARSAWLLGALLQGMLDEIERPAFASRLALDTLLQCFVVHLLRESSTMHDSHRNVRHALAPHRLRRVLDFIKANLAADLRLAELATVACSSPYHFSRAFRLTTGLSPYRYLIHQRIEHGKALLCDDSLSIADAAKQCGFRSTRQFATMFKQICGVSPARFRRELMLTGAVVAALWGLAAASGLLIGAMIAFLWELPHRIVASTMGFGAGVLVAVLSFELLHDAAKHGSLGTITSAFVIGATLFCAANWLLARRGAKHRNRCGECEQQANETDQPGSGMSIAIGAVVDGIPESVVIGLTLVGGGTIGPVVLAGFFIANVPQGLSGAFGMKKAKRSAAYVFTLWTAVAVLSGAAAAFGFLVVSRMPPAAEAVANALAAGGVLAMLAETMIPEAFAQAPVFIGFATAIGFTAAYALSMVG